MATRDPTAPTAPPATAPTAALTTIDGVSKYLDNAKGTLDTKIDDMLKALKKGVTDAGQLGQSLYKQSISSNGMSATTAMGTTGPAGQTGTIAGLQKLGAYFIGIVIILVIISIFIHFFITPIYSLRPGDPGIITIPLADNGVLFWDGANKQYPSPTSNGNIIKNADLPIASTYYNFTFIMDMFIFNPTNFSSANTNNLRLIVSRGATVRSSLNTGNTMLSILSNYNFAIAMQPNTTDLIISVLNAYNHSEDIIVENAPVQKAFRIGVIVMDNIMEVYINGKLVKTRKFETSLMSVTGDIMYSSLNTVYARNLKIWNQVLYSNQVFHATPAMSKDSDFPSSPMTSSSGCGGDNSALPIDVSVPPF